jgi:hypothetical protein
MLTRLYLGIWKFLDTSALPRGGVFPHLLELVLCSIKMESRDLDFLLDGCSILEMLGIMGSKKGVCLCLTSQHLRCVQFTFCHVESIFMVDCPNIERLFLWGFRNEGSCIRFMIGHVVAWVLGAESSHMLEIDSTIINPLNNVH